MMNTYSPFLRDYAIEVRIATAPREQFTVAEKVNKNITHI